MDIDECKCTLEIAIKMLNFFQHVLLELLSLIRLVEGGIEEEQIGGGLISFLKDAQLLYVIKIFIDDSLHTLVEEWVVG